MSAIAAPPRRSALRSLIRTEAKLLIREPVALFWGIVFPLILLTVMGLASNQPDKDLGGLRLIDVYVPVCMCFVIAVQAINVLPTVLAAYREKGILRRIATTPAGPARLLGAQIVVNLGMCAIGLVTIAVAARLAFDVSLPGQVLGFVLAALLGAGALLGLGALIAAVAPTGRVAGALGTVVFFPMMFFAGLWVPRPIMPAGLLHVSDYTPLGATVAAVQETMAGAWPAAQHLAVLAGYAILLVAAAAKWFRWE
jgi:ABC-2 type transport system permease protein